MPYRPSEMPRPNDRFLPGKVSEWPKAAQEEERQKWENWLEREKRDYDGPNSHKYL